MLCIMIDKEGRVWKTNDSGLNQELFQRKIEIPERLGIHSASLIFFSFLIFAYLSFQILLDWAEGKSLEKNQFSINVR